MKMQHTCVGMTRKLRFESSVISYGNQTTVDGAYPLSSFESSVISYGNQTRGHSSAFNPWFESSVISYGNQTVKKSLIHVLLV